MRNGRLDLLATDHLGRAVHDAVYASGTTSPPSFARFTSLDLDAAHDFDPDWAGAADTCVAIRHAEPGQDPARPLRVCTTHRRWSI